QLAARDVEIEVVVDDRLVETLVEAADGDMRTLRHRRRHRRGCGISAKCCESHVHRHNAQNDLPTLETSIFSATTPICTQTSANFWSSSRCCGVMALALGEASIGTTSTRASGVSVFLARCLRAAAGLARM